MSKRTPILSMTLGAGALVLVSVFGAWAQLQTSGQQACLNAVNKDGAAVAKEQGKESLACVKGAGKGTLPGTAQTCLTADLKGKVAKRKAKTTADEAKSCSAAPSFGFTGATTVNTAAQQGKVDLVADVYGPSLDAAIITCASSKAGCACQQKVSASLEKLAAVKFATFVSCKKAALKAGASAVAALEACVNNAGTPGSIAADTKGKLAKGVASLSSTIGKACTDVANAFPGNCNARTQPALGVCLDTQVECRVCQAINEMDGLAVNCDLFDDGVANGSCASGAGPTPTPTVTPTSTAPTPTSTATATNTPTPQPTFVPGTIIKGSLNATGGRFNYNLTVGLPGANNACNTNFAGTHACTYLELQNAAALNELKFLKDLASNSVTSFWAIDSGQPILQQCNDDAPGGSDLNWEYGTAHTASRGQRVSLNNSAGTLGSLTSNVQCNVAGTSWVGCCQ
ncbi:MAG: hypothetical protein ABI080_16800 [Candidatus Binatia bacterium]